MRTCILMCSYTAVCNHNPSSLQYMYIRYHLRPSLTAAFIVSESIWRTDLDFMVVHRDRLVVLSFMTSANSTGGQQPTLSSALPMIGVPTSNSTTPDPSPGALPLTSSQVTHTVLKTLKTLMGHDNNSHTHSENFGKLIRWCCIPGNFNRYC